MQLNSNKESFDYVASHIEEGARREYDGKFDFDINEPYENTQDEELLKSLNTVMKKCNYSLIYKDNDRVIFIPDNYVQSRGRGLIYSENELEYLSLFGEFRYDKIKLSDNWYYFYVTGVIKD